LFIFSWLWYICIHCCLLNACFFLWYSACAINNCIFVFITLLLLFQFVFTKPDLNDNGKISRRTILINCLVFNANFSCISVISWHAEQYHQFGLSKYHQNKIKRSEKHEYQQDIEADTRCFEKKLCSIYRTCREVPFYKSVLWC
jgi:hypothetical protein